MTYVESVQINLFVPITIRKGEWFYDFSATVSPADATCPSVTWVTDDPSVIAVNPNTGYIYGLKIGTANLYAIAKDGSGAYDSCAITVAAAIPVTSIAFNKTHVKIQTGHSCVLNAAVAPKNATNQTLVWRSGNTNVATVCDGVITAKSPGTTTITATAADNCCVTACCQVTVTNDILVSSVIVDPPTLSLPLHEVAFLHADIYPANAKCPCVTWCSSNPSAVFVNPLSGMVMALRPGISTVYATVDDGSGVYGSCEVWVKGKTPVFLLHGRTGNSLDTWGAANSILANPLNPDEKDNNEFCASVEAMSSGKFGRIGLYVSYIMQKITSHQLDSSIKVDGKEVDHFTVPGIFNGEFKKGNYTTTHPEGGNLAYYLKEQGYQENVNLFAFNYPNEDAVVHSAKKLDSYIKDLINYVKTSGSDEMKACFFASRQAYDCNDFRINLVAHSMGGLVSRYYIENLRQDAHVEKLITVDTPHWGSRYADMACTTGDHLLTSLHKLCDHDLRFNSAMNGGTLSTEHNCNAIGFNCYNGEYTLTNALQYQRPRCTKYYAIAGIDYNSIYQNLNDYTFEMPVNFTTYQQIANFMTSKNIGKMAVDSGNYIPMPVKSVGDNMVGFMSQIGWTENQGDTPNKRIQMEKIFIDVDTNGGNGGEIIGLEALNMFHGKILHRPVVMQQVYQYLQE